MANESQGGSIMSGAGQGAAAGSVAGPWGAVIGGAIGAGAGAMNYASAKKAREKMEEEAEKVRALYEQIQLPNFDVKSIKPEDFQLIQKYIPEAAPYIAEKNPKLIEETAKMKEGSEAQIGALRRLMQASSGNDPEYLAKMNQSARRAQQEAQSRQASILQDAQRRGALNSGMQMASQMQAGAGSMDALAMQQQGQAADSYRNQLEALRQGAALGGDIRQGDIALQSRNNDVINQFNQRNTAAQQAYANQRADIANSAQKYNVGMAQDLANKNVAGRNESAVRNQDMMNRLAQQNYTNQVDKANNLAGYHGMVRQDTLGGAQDRANAVTGIAGALGGAVRDYGQYSNQQDQTDAYNRRTNAMMNQSAANTKFNPFAVAGDEAYEANGRKWGQA